MNCGVWRYHPTRKVFEVVAHGSTNPWGLDFNEEGEMFITNCVIKHVFHVVPGGHYKRMFGQDITPNVYGLMESCADHIHWGGGKWTSSRGGEGVHDKPGGGHAHAGCMIYLGDNWPAKYRGKLFTCNIHGTRVNMDVLKRKGSGYVASHGPDFLKVPDPWFRGLEMKYGPDGGVYITDWSDIGECHDYKDVHRENGRIYKITFGDVKPWKGDLAKLNQTRLSTLTKSNNDWFVRHALRLLREHQAAGRKELAPAVKLPSKGRALWRQLLWAKSLGATFKASQMFGSLAPDGYQGKEKLPDIRLKVIDAYIRAWLVHREVEAAPEIRNLEVLSKLARTDTSPIVRLALASGLQRLPLNDRWPIAEALVGHAEDAKDANIPLMIWYGIEPAVSKDRKRAISLLKKTKIPLVRTYIARRLAETAK